jgi:acetyl-CoA C-acetyltransferase
LRRRGFRFGQVRHILAIKETFMAEAYIIDTVRTPRGIGKKGKGALADMLPQHLAATVLKAIKDRNKLPDDSVQDVIWGCSAQYGLQAGDMGRMAALDAGLGTGTSGVTLDRFCGSSLTATNLAAASIMSGMEDLVIAGGTEMMSFMNDFGARLREAGFGGSLSANPRLQEKYPQTHQGVAADAIAAKDGISREDLDKFGAESQRRAAIAIKEGRFAKSTVPVVDDEGKVILDHEEYPRPETTAESLSALKPAFSAFVDMPSEPGGLTFGGLINKVHPDVKIVPLHHAGISSGVVDGASAILLASKEGAEKYGLKPRARIVAMANHGDDPTLMLTAPTGAVTKVLAKAGLTKDDIDVWEINEAFATIVEKVIRDHDLDRAKVNPNGGAIALGHPIAATGAILVGTALDELERTGGRYALITMCTAGGMAPALIIERV